MSSNLNSTAKDITLDLLNGGDMVEMDGITLNEFQLNQVTSTSLLSGRICSFFDISAKDCIVRPDSVEFVLRDISVKFSVDYKEETNEFTVVTAVELFDPSLISKEWLIIHTDQLDQLTGARKSVYLNLETPLEDNALLRTFIGVRNLVNLQQKAKNNYIEAYNSAIKDMRYRVRVLIGGVLGGIGSVVIAENTQELVGLLTVMGVSSFIAILLKDKLID